MDTHFPTMQLHASSLLASLARFSSAKVLIVGDLMLDEYLFGDVERISPEAPVPVMLVEQEKILVGGAGNVARNIRALGGDVVLLGTVGDDRYGSLVSTLLSAELIQPNLVCVPNKPTTVKTRVLARQQQMLRIDKEDTTALDPSIVDALLQKIKESLPSVGAVVLSDYGKGVISPALMSGLLNLLQSYPSIPILVDPKPQNTGLYKYVSLLTPNAKELRDMTGMPVRMPQEIVAAGRSLMQTLSLPKLITTLGADGMAVFVSPDEVWHISTSAQEVFDVTGAGDTVIGVSALALSAGSDLAEACAIANFAAGIVVGQVGAATVSMEELVAVISIKEQASLSRWV